MEGGNAVSTEIRRKDKNFAGYFSLLKKFESFGAPLQDAPTQGKVKRSKTKKETPFKSDKADKEIPYGYLKSEDVAKIKGHQIQFRDLKGMIGQQVLLESPRESAIDYPPVKITDYRENSTECFRRTKGDFISLGKIDEVFFTDGRSKNGKSIGIISEMYCRGGRHSEHFPYPEAFYMINR